MIRKLLSLVPPQSRHLLPRYITLLVAFAVAQAAAYLLLVPALVAIFGPQPPSAWPWVGGILVAVALVAVLNYLHGMVGFEISATLMRDTQYAIGDRIASVPLGWFSTISSGRVARTISSSTMAVTTLFAHLIAPLVSGILVPVFVGIGMLFIDWRLSLSMLIAAPVLWLVSRWGSAIYARADKRLDDASAAANARVVEFAQAQQVLRGSGALERGFGALDDALDAQSRAARAQVWSILPGKLSFTGVVQAVLVVLVYLVVSFALDGTIQPIAAIALFAVSSRFIEPLSAIAELGSAFRASENAVDSIDELLDATPLEVPADSASATDSSVTLAGVGFGYEAGAAVIHDFDLVVPAGTTTALVGPSGSGKTTVTHLIARFFDVDKGSVRVGAHDVRDYSSEELMAQLSLVFQDVYLFDDTILENIRLGRPGASDDDVHAAAARVGIEEIIERLPDGWSTRVGEGGTSLSGGERQRVSIARALLKNAPIVLLDEATSALDPHNEAAVVKGLADLTGGRTVIVVAHRMATVRHADQIVFLDKGRIVERGTHDELLALDGRYAAFWAERSLTSGWRLAAEPGAADRAARPSSRAVKR